MNGKCMDITENIEALSGQERRDIIGSDAVSDPTKYIDLQPSDRLRSFQYYISRGLAPPLEAAELELNGLAGNYKVNINTILDTLMYSAKAVRLVGRFHHKNGSVIETLFAVTLVMKSSGVPDYFLSFGFLNTARVISKSSVNNAEAEWHRNLYN